MGTFIICSFLFVVVFYFLASIPFRRSFSKSQKKFEQTRIDFDRKCTDVEEQILVAQQEELAEDEPQLLEISDFVVKTSSDAERVHNIESLTVRFGLHKGKKWSDVPTQYLQWMLTEEHKYVQIARVLLAARQSNYNFV